MRATVKDPVCGMAVAPAQFETIYEGVHYAFCSEQCRQRFAANPHLYIGVPGEKAARQKGVELFKRRRFRMGVKDIEIQDGNTVTLTYDLVQATADQLEAKMEEVGAKLGEGWAEGLRRGFVHYMEECEVGNLEVHPRHGHGI